MEFRFNRKVEGYVRGQKVSVRRNRKRKRIIIKKNHPSGNFRELNSCAKQAGSCLFLTHHLPHLNGFIIFKGPPFMCLEPLWFIGFATQLLCRKRTRKIYFKVRRRNEKLDFQRKSINISKQSNP